MAGELREELTRTAKGCGVAMKDLTVLAKQNDPFRIDTPAGHRDGEWLAIHVHDLLPPDRRIHLRGLHYVLVTEAPTKPNGEPYRNTDADWKWLQEKAGDAARWLEYIPFERIVDQRNAAPIVRRLDRGDPWPFLHVGLDVDVPDADDLEPTVGVVDFTSEQPYRLVLIGEKSSLADVLDPIATRYGADLYLPTGEISDTLIHGIMADADADGRPLVIFYFSDADPAGWQMPISVGRKLQAFETAFFPAVEFEEYRVALTPEQVRGYGLPSTPLNATEKRANAWRRATGTEQTEIDALASLRPDLLRRIAREAIAPFFDTTLERRVIDAKQAWRREAQAIVDDALDQDMLDRVRTEAGRKLAELREEIDAINDALRLSADDFDLPPIEIPTAEVAGGNGSALLDSRWPFLKQTVALIRSKQYRGIV